MNTRKMKAYLTICSSAFITILLFQNMGEPNPQIYSQLPPDQMEVRNRLISKIAENRDEALKASQNLPTPADRAAAIILHKRMNQFYSQKLISLVKARNCAEFRMLTNNSGMSGSFYFYNKKGQLASKPKRCKFDASV